MKETRAGDVSVVIETETEGEGHGIRLRDALEGWSAQTAASRIGELIVVAPRPPSEAEKRAAGGWSLVWLMRPGFRYYENKNEGIAASHGDFVAVADADVVPAPDWLERALETLEGEADSVAAVTGRTRRTGGLFARELAVFEWPNLGSERREASEVLAHNLLLRGAVARAFRFGAPRLRHGGDFELSRHLLAAGHRIVYEPAVRMIHNASSDPAELWQHIVARGFTDARFRIESRWLPPPRTVGGDVAGRTLALSTRLLRLRRDVGISPARLPLSLAFAVVYALGMGIGLSKALLGEPEPREPF